MKTYTIKDWWRAHEGMNLLWFDRPYKEIGQWWVIRGHGKLWELWYYVKCKLWHKYNTVNPRTLPPTWRDADTRLLHVMFQILCDVVEQEDWFNNRCYYDESDQGKEYDWDGRDEFQEVAVLYDWWTRRRQQRLDREAKAMDDWHDKFQALGGLRLGKMEVMGEDGLFHEVPGLSSRIYFPADRPSNSPEDLAEERRLHTAQWALDEAGDVEDEEMMIRLVKIAGYLWT